MNANELMGQALLDFFQGNHALNLYSESNISEKDHYPMHYFFRDFAAMPLLEQKALELCKGSILDIGCGAGNHSLYLQNQEHKVTALDASFKAIEVCRLRGINEVICTQLLDFSENTFDTLLLLMNGIGIVETLDNLSKYLQHFKRLLKPEGQILVDSSDLQYMYDRAENGAILVPANMAYYGELDYTLYYGEQKSQAFKWLYLDPRMFKQSCLDNGLSFEIIAKGDNYNYLARLTVLD